jgi:hypothetical protein
MGGLEALGNVPHVLSRYFELAADGNSEAIKCIF